MTPSPTRLARYRRIERRRALPIPVKAVMGVSVALLSLAILWAASGMVGPLVGSAVHGFGTFVSSVGSIVSSPAPTSAPALAAAPVIVGPSQPYTNDGTIGVTVNVPAAVVGLDGYTVRLWVTLPDASPELVQQVAVGPTSVLLIPDVELAKGRNDFQASIAGPGGEGEKSAIATWILDQSRPAIKITAPKDKSSTTKTAVIVKGKTQALSTVRIANDINDASITVEAGKDGLFQASIPVDAGTNTITITVTDVAGNPNTATLTIRKGKGKLKADLSGTAYSFTAKKLPRRVTFTTTVTGPDGRRVPGATALFTISVPGLEAIVSGEIPTNASGVASFSTSIPKGAMAGSGLATVLVTTDHLGTATDRQVLTVK